MTALTVEDRTLRPFFSMKELARYLNISERTVHQLIASGELPTYKVGGSRRIDPVDVDRYLASHRETKG